MFSKAPPRSAPQRTRISRVGAGYSVIAPQLYVWDESLDVVCVWGAELGVLPGCRAWRRTRSRSRAAAAATQRPILPLPP